ncbi:MAG: hypothetical protein ACFFD2_21225 [Promethearchaeota archaeon]
MNYNPLDKDFIQTEENFFFCIVGYIHPPDRILSYLKYIPDDSGKWKYEDQNLKRVLPYYSAKSVVNTLEFLKIKYPQYIFYDEYNKIMFSAVPYFYIKKYYSSQEKLKEIFSLSKLDSLQNKLKSFISILSELSGLSIDAFGVTGSILLNIHNPKFSDLDITIYGYDNSIKVKRIMKEIFERNHQEIEPLDEDESIRWQQDKVKQFGMSPDDAKSLFIRKWNMGLFQKTRFSLHPIRNLKEIYEKYGNKVFVGKGPIEIHAKILDNSEALFLPSKYRITDVNVQKGNDVQDIEEIVSYEGVFDSVVEKDEFVKAIGLLELVTDNSKGKSYHRVVIGSKKGNSREFLSVIK